MTLTSMALFHRHGNKTLTDAVMACVPAAVFLDLFSGAGLTFTPTVLLPTTPQERKKSLENDPDVTFRWPAVFPTTVYCFFYVEYSHDQGQHCRKHQPSLRRGVR